MTRTAVVCFVAAAAAFFASAQEAERDRWYFTAGAGLNSTAALDQNGYSYDNVAYPDLDYSHLPGGKPDGFRWHYVVETESGQAFQAAVGRMFKSGGRLELRYDRRNAPLEHGEKNSAYLYGDPIKGRETEIVGTPTWGIGDLLTDTLSLNVYYGVPIADGKIAPYLGVGVGLSRAEATDVYFESQYTGTAEPGGPAPETFNNLQNVDVSGVASTQILSAGVDFRLTNETLVGLKYVYAAVDDIEQEDLYQTHPKPGFTSVTKFSGMNHWSIGVEVKYLLGE